MATNKTKYIARKTPPKVFEKEDDTREVVKNQKKKQKKLKGVLYGGKK